MMNSPIFEGIRRDNENFIVYTMILTCAKIQPTAKYTVVRRNSVVQSELSIDKIVLIVKAKENWGACVSGKSYCTYLFFVVCSHTESLHKMTRRNT